MDKDQLIRYLIALESQINANLHLLERENNLQDIWWVYHQFVSIRCHIHILVNLIENGGDIFDDNFIN